jgi:PRC-barrel domain
MRRVYKNAGLPRWENFSSSNDVTCGQTHDFFAVLQGCPVITLDGNAIGYVDDVIVDVPTRHLRYVMLASNSGAAMALPWQSLCFDSALASLVFHA